MPRSSSDLAKSCYFQTLLGPIPLGPRSLSSQMEAEFLASSAGRMRMGVSTAPSTLRRGKRVTPPGMEGFTHEQSQEGLPKTIHCQGFQSSSQPVGRTEIQLTAAGSTALLCLAPSGEQRDSLAWQSGEGLSRGRAKGFPVFATPAPGAVPCSPTDTKPTLHPSLTPGEPQQSGLRQPGGTPRAREGNVGLSMLHVAALKFVP